MIELFALLGAALVGFGIGAGWMWRIVDSAIREFEDDGEHGGSFRYRVGRIVR